MRQLADPHLPAHGRIEPLQHRGIGHRREGGGIQRDAAVQPRLPALLGAVDHRRALAAAVLRIQLKRRLLPVDARAHEHRDRLAAGQRTVLARRADRVARLLQALIRPAAAAVAARPGIRRDINLTFRKGARRHTRHQPRRHPAQAHSPHHSPSSPFFISPNSLTISGRSAYFRHWLNEAQFDTRVSPAHAWMITPFSFAPLIRSRPRSEK